MLLLSLADLVDRCFCRWCCCFWSVLVVVVVFVGFVVGVVVNALVAVVVAFLLLLGVVCNLWVSGCGCGCCYCCSKKLGSQESRSRYF